MKKSFKEFLNEADGFSWQELNISNSAYNKIVRDIKKLVQSDELSKAYMKMLKLLDKSLNGNDYKAYIDKLKHANTESDELSIAKTALLQAKNSLPPAPFIDLNRAFNK